MKPKREGKWQAAGLAQKLREEEVEGLGSLPLSGPSCSTLSRPFFCSPHHTLGFSPNPPAPAPILRRSLPTGLPHIPPLLRYRQGQRFQVFQG